jgi:hypothetical protein
MTYGPYPEYPQLYGAFDHAVTILDTLFHLGSEAKFYIRPAAASAGDLAR